MAAEKKAKILVFGNELIAEDSLAPKIARKLAEKGGELEKEGIEFVFCNSYDEIAMHGEESGAIILDTVEGIKQPKIIKTSELSLSMNKPYSAHDLDLGFFLGLMKPEGVKIVGVPKSKKKPDAKTVELAERLLVQAVKEKTKAKQNGRTRRKGKRTTRGA